MRLWIGVLLLVAAFARATPLQVDRQPVDLLHAERMELTERFELVRIETSVALVGSTRLDAVEMSEAMTPAGTFVSRGHWTYAITLRERAPDAVSIGRFALTLEAAGVPTRTVTLAQDVANPLVAEGARVVFDLGRTMPPNAHFVVSMRELPRGTIVSLASAFDDDFAYVWRDNAQNTNPTLAARVGETVTFVVTNGDGTTFHNFQIAADEPTDDMHNLGDQETMVWSPDAPGLYAYRCQYHSTMEGIIEVQS